MKNLFQYHKVILVPLDCRSSEGFTVSIGFQALLCPDVRLLRIQAGIFLLELNDFPAEENFFTKEVF